MGLLRSGADRPDFMPSGGSLVPGDVTSKRDIVVVIPELVMTHWWAALLHNNRGTLMRTLLRMQCGPRVFIVDAPYRLPR
jgi:hypothetical protein